MQSCGVDKVDGDHKSIEDSQRVIAEGRGQHKVGEVSKMSCRDDRVRGLKQNDHSILQQLYAKGQQVMDIE